MKFAKKGIMDIKDIDTECIPETMLLCAEKISYIFHKVIRFWFRELAIIDIFPFSVLYGTVFLLSNCAEKSAHIIRYMTRIFIVDPLGKIQKWLFPKMGYVVRLFRGVGG